MTVFLCYGSTDKVLDALNDQTSRGQVLLMADSEARARYPNVVVAFLGANQYSDCGVFFSMTESTWQSPEDKDTGPGESSHRVGPQVCDERQGQPGR